MASIVNNCLEAVNSTDCLLRVLITFLEESQNKDGSDYDWDPLTFGFTVAISLSAASFALITILQAILAAGPGRKRSDRHAIGRWSAKTQWYWNFRNFSFIHVSHTPVLTLSSLKTALGGFEIESQQPNDAEVSLDTRGYLTEQSLNTDRNLGGEVLRGTGESLYNQAPMQGAGNHIWHKAIHKYQVLAGFITALFENIEFSMFLRTYKQITHLTGPAATWVHFLEKIGLGDIDMGTFTLRQNNANYLPVDMVAVPAYADIGFIATTMSLLGAQLRTSQDELYPSMRGDAVQLDIRQHATLGTIGSFSSYSAKILYPSVKDPRPELAQLQVARQKMAIKNANGEMELGLWFADQESTSPSSSSPRGRESLENEDTQLRNRINSHNSSCSRCQSFPFYPIKESNYLLKFLLTSTPESAPVIFPWESLQLFDVVDALTTNSPHFTTLDMNDPPLHLTDLIFRDKERVHITFSHLANDVCPCQQIFFLSTKVLEGETSFKHLITQLSFARRLELRRYTLLLLRDIDKWLASREGREHPEKKILSPIQARPGAPIAPSIHRSWMLSALEDFFERKLPEVLGRSFTEVGTLQFLASRLRVAISTNIHSEHARSFLNHLKTISESRSTPAIQKWRDVMDYSDANSPDDAMIAHVLIWRTILLYVLYGLANDNSALIKSGVWDDIIPII